jgi:hypothetical protein
VHLSLNWKKWGERKQSTVSIMGRYPRRSYPITLQWLEEQSRGDERKREAFNSEQIEIARTASAAAERAAAAAERQAAAAEIAAAEARRANKRATTALVIAMISIVATAAMSGVGIWITHLDAHK